MSARGIEIRLLARSAATLVLAVILALSASVTVILLLHDAHLAALIALLLLFLTAVLSLFSRALPVNCVDRLLLNDGGVCEADDGMTRWQATLVSVFSAGALTVLQLDSGGVRQRVVLWTASWPRAQRSALGRWLNSASYP